jgi:hypothetical protein
MTLYQEQKSCSVGCDVTFIAHGELLRSRHEAVLMYYVMLYQVLPGS